jgi:hypothetical protein
MFDILISKDMVKKIAFLLKTFPDREWSGPAFYDVKFEKNGFPKKYILKYFKPIDLGGTSDTEFSGELLNSFIPKIWKEHPETQDLSCGLIHSHHNMGAFLSATDTEQMEESIKDSKAKDDSFYPSLVVSSKSGARYHFGVAYKDMYDYISIIEFKEKHIHEEGVKIRVPSTWVDEVKFIKAEDKKKTAALFTTYSKNKWTRNGNITQYNPQQLNLAEFPTNNGMGTATLAKSAMNITEKLPRELSLIDKEAIATDKVLLGTYYRMFQTRMWGLEEEALTIMEEILDKSEDLGMITDAECITLTNELYSPDALDDTEIYNQGYGL